MCMVKTPKMQAPQAPVKYAAMKAPDGGAIISKSERRVTDRRRAAAQTILTSGSGLLPDQTGDTAGKQLLGQ